VGEQIPEPGQWIKDLTAQCREFAGKLAGRQSLMIPAEDPELRDAPQLSGIIRDDRHLAQRPELPVLITGLTAVMAPEVHGEQTARSRASVS